MTRTRPNLIALIVAAWCFLPSLSLGQEWLQLTPSSGAIPQTRTNATAVYDLFNHAMIVFGGRNASGVDLNDVWSFNLGSQTWSEISPTQGSAPAPRRTPSGVYDPDNRRMIIWSGQGGTLYNDIWAFDLTNATWSEVSPPDPKPSRRYGSVSIFDPAAKEVVSFAGFTTSGRFDDSWRLSTKSVAWQDVTPTGARPEQRCLHSASYDSRNHRMIVYGGQRSGPLDDIWAFDLASHTWANLTPQQRPAGRYFSTNIYDPANHRVIIFGGRLSSAKTNAVWTFDLTNRAWTELTFAGPTPAARDGATAVYVPSEGRMVIFGGSGGGFFNDVWSLNNLGLPVSVDRTTPELPKSFELLGNFPNPFNPTTAIVYELSKGSLVSLRIYNERGALVRSLVNANLNPGQHTTSWDGTDEDNQFVASGLYFYRLRVAEVTATGKALLIR